MTRHWNLRFENPPYQILELVGGAPRIGTRPPTPIDDLLLYGRLLRWFLLMRPRERPFVIEQSSPVGVANDWRVLMLWSAETLQSPLGNQEFLPFHLKGLCAPRHEFKLPGNLWRSALWTSEKSPILLLMTTGIDQSDHGSTSTRIELQINAGCGLGFTNSRHKHVFMSKPSGNAKASDV